jgi:EF-hand domain pair
MFPLIAAGGALSYLTALLQSSTANTSGASGSDPLSALNQAFTGGDADGDGDQSTASAQQTGAGSPPPPFDPGMLAALISLQSQSGANSSGQGPSGLFAKLDADGDGQISQTEFENALGGDGVDTSSADALFNKLDTNGDGNISQSELAAARHGHGHHHAHAGSGQGGLSSLLNGLDATGATTQTTTNPDGSTTTTISYADGSTVDMTTPASTQGDGSSGSGSGTSSQSNLLEELIKLQSKLLAQSGSALSTTA